MGTTEDRVQAEAELSKAIEGILGSSAQQTNPNSPHAKLGCTLIVVLPDEVKNGFPSKEARDEFQEKINKLKELHDEIAKKYELTVIGEGPCLAAGGILVFYVGFETEYAKSLRG